MKKHLNRLIRIDITPLNMALFLEEGMEYLLK